MRASALRFDDPGNADAPIAKAIRRVEIRFGSGLFYAAPAIYLANRPHLPHLSVTCEFGAGGAVFGSRSIGPEHEGQLNGAPARSLAIRFNACAGLYVAGRGLRMQPPSLKGYFVCYCE